MDASLLSLPIAVAGLLIGILMGLTGMGGGALMAPILILLVGVRPLFVVGTDLVYAAIAKMFGAWEHQRLGHVDLRVAAAMGMASVPASLLGVGLIVQLRETMGDQVDTIILKALGFVLLLVAAVMAIKVVRRPTYDETAARAPLTVPRIVVLAAGGGAIGFLVGVTSVGSGSLIVAFLTALGLLTPRRLVGTDVFHGAILSGAAALAHGIAGHVDYVLTANLLLGAIPGVVIGSRLTARLPQRAIASAMAVVLFATGLKLI